SSNFQPISLTATLCCEFLTSSSTRKFPTAFSANLPQLDSNKRSPTARAPHFNRTLAHTRECHFTKVCPLILPYNSLILDQPKVWIARLHLNGYSKTRRLARSPQNSKQTRTSHTSRHSATLLFSSGVS